LCAADSGEIFYKGQNIACFSKNERREFRAAIQVVFQDPYSSLDPKQKAGAILEEALVIQHIGTQAQRRQRALEMLETVGLGQEHYFRFPHEFSGGQRQRLALARALVIKPEIVICDEPVSALDVSIQSQILNTLKTLQEEMHLTMLFITHDIRVVRHISNRVGVMQAGAIVEEADTEALFASPRHAYTQKLFSAVPDFGV
jgi:oligopeptide transport system ATP-binding protein